MTSRTATPTSSGAKSVLSRREPTPEQRYGDGGGGEHGDPPVNAAVGEVCGERPGACECDDRKRGSDRERDRQAEQEHGRGHDHEAAPTPKMAADGLTNREIGQQLYLSH